MTFWALSGLINGIASSVFGFFVYSKNPKLPLNKLWFLFSLTIAFWSYSYFFWQISTEKFHALFWCRSLMLGAIFIPVLFLHFLLRWLELDNSKRRILAVSYGISIVAFIFNFTPYFVKDVTSILWFRFWPQPGIMYLPFLIFWAGLILYCWYIMFLAMRTSSSIKRNQIKYVLLGAVIGFSGGFTNYPLWYGIEIPPYGNILVSVYVGLMAYAMLKHRLMDIRIAVTRAGIFAFVFLFVVIIPFWIAPRYIHTSFWWIPIALMGVLALAAPFTYSRLRQAAEDIILVDQKRYQKALKELAPNLIRIRDEKQLAQKVVSEVMALVGFSWCGFYLKGAQDYRLMGSEAKTHLKLPTKIAAVSEFINVLKNKNELVLGEYLPKIEPVEVGLVCPLFISEELEGFILLSPKEKAEVFSEIDTNAFSILSGQVSLALSEICYFTELQKATEEKYRLLVEKERLQSAFEISEAYRHELGNILNIIAASLGNLMFIGDTMPTKEEIEQTRVAINNNVKRGKKIFAAISTYNENSHSESKPARLDELLKTVINEKGEELTKNHIILKADTGKGIILSADDNLIYALRYLLECAIAAIEYVNPEQKLIEISLETQDASARLKVSDTGQDATSDEIYTGIGVERGKEGGILYFITRRIIFDHQGTFQMASFANGKGTSVIIEIPLLKEGG